jgi:hypothetical protein
MIDYIMKNILNYLILIFLIGCGSTSTNTHTQQTTKTKLISIAKIKIDNDFNINDHTDKLPFTIKTKINNTNIYLLASLHANNPQSNTYKTVKYLLDMYPIDSVILEGTPSDIDIQTAYSNKKECINDASSCLSEMYYTYSYAKNKDILFSGGEANPSDTYKHLVNTKGYTLDDYMGFLYVRDAVSLNDTNQMSKTTLIQYNEEKRLYIQRELGFDIKFSYEDWEQWYKTNLHTDLDLSSFNQSTLKPTDSKDATIIENISYEFNTIRDAHLIQTINNKIQSDYKNILIIYGQGHINTIYKNFTDRSTEDSYLLQWY